MEQFSETPRTDAEACDGWSADAVCVSVEFARELEKELRDVRNELERLKDSYIKLSNSF